MKRGRSRLVAGLLVTAALMAACSDDDDDSASSTAEVETTAGTEETAAATTAPDDTAAESTAGTAPEDTEAPGTTAGGAGEEPTGEPIKLSVIATFNGITGAPEVFDGAAAAAEAINAAGGIADPAGGEAHPIEIVECRFDSTSAAAATPQAALECATNALEAGVIADVGKYLFAQLAIEAFQQASVPLIGTFVVDQTDMTNPAVFALSGGAAMELPGVGVAMERAGATTIGFVSADNPAGRALPAFFAPVLKEAEITTQQYLPLDPSMDVTAAVSNLVQDNPDGIVLAQTADISVRLTKALRAAGYQGMIGWTAAGLTDTTIEQLGEDTDNIILASNYPAVTDVSNERIQEFNDDMDAYSPDGIRSEFSLNAWFSMKTTADILATLPEFTAEAMMAATPGFVVDSGLVPAFTLGEPANFVGLPAIPRATVYPQALEGSEVVAAGDVIDLNELAAVE